MSSAISSVAIGVPTFNRRIFVEANGRSLRRAAIPPGLEVKLLVVDDASAEYDAAFLAEVYPVGAQILRRESNSGGADHAIADLFQRCLALNADAILLLDSDLIVDPDFLTKGLALLQQSDGMVSLFNTPNHPAREKFGALLRKSSIGSAGALWSRALAEEVRAQVPIGPKWDWRFCAFLEASGRRVLCAEQSLVQHIGFFEGENSSLDYGDYGVGFAAGSFDNLAITLEFLVRAQIALARSAPGAKSLQLLDRTFAAVEELKARAEAQNGRLADLESRIVRLERYSLRDRLNRSLRQGRQFFGRIRRGDHA